MKNVVGEREKLIYMTICLTCEQETIKKLIKLRVEIANIPKNSKGTDCK